MVNCGSTPKNMCKHCGKEIPWDHVQQGGCHVDCHETEIDVWFISLPDSPGSGFCENKIEAVKAVIENINEPHLINKTRMRAGLFYNLPEFNGF